MNVAFGVLIVHLCFVCSFAVFVRFVSYLVATFVFVCLFVFIVLLLINRGCSAVVCCLLVMCYVFLF